MRARGQIVELSVIVPVYGCAGCLTALHERLRASLTALTDSIEFVFVDDGSTDGGWDVLLEIAARDPQVKLVRLSRNFGQHQALTAGLERSNGRWTVVMDCDLQNPPEVIPRLYAKAQEGYDFVLTRRVGRKQVWFRTHAADLYFRAMNALLKSDMSSETANFSILSRKVVDAFLAVRDKDRHFLMILYWLGFRHTTIEFEHAERYAGESTYTWQMLFRFALDGLFFQTITLLRWIVYFGFAISATGGVFAVFALVAYFVRSHPYPGWTSLAVLMLLLSGFIIVTAGVTGLYIGRIFTQVKDRPLYLVDETVNYSGQVVQPEVEDDSKRVGAEAHGLVEAPGGDVQSG